MSIMQDFMSSYHFMCKFGEECLDATGLIYVFASMM